MITECTLTFETADDASKACDIAVSLGFTARNDVYTKQLRIQFDKDNGNFESLAQLLHEEIGQWLKR